MDKTKNIDIPMSQNDIDIIDKHLAERAKETKSLVSLNERGYSVQANVDDILQIFAKCNGNGKILKTRKEFFLFAFLAKSLDDSEKHVLKAKINNGFGININLDFKF